MQRLNILRFSSARRAVAGMVAASSTTVACPMRFQSGNSGQYVNKSAKKKVDMNNDERWLEAEIDRNILTPEERYAHDREMRLIRKMMDEMRQDHDKKLENANEERNREIDRLRKEMEGLESRMNDLKKKS